jgi:hypothetical protein
MECVEEITKELKDFRSDENFESVINSAKEMARHIRCIFSCYRNSKKKMFDYEANDEPINNPKDNFKIQFFFVTTLSRMTESESVGIL